MTRYSSSGFSGWEQNSCFCSLFQVTMALKEQSIPTPSYHHHHVSLYVWCSWFNVSALHQKMSWDPCHPKIFQLISQQNIWQTWEEALCSNSLGTINDDLICGEICWSLDVYLGSFVTSWMSRQCALGGILVSWALLGRFITVLMFSPFGDNGSQCDSLDPWNFRNGFIILSRLIYFNNFLSHLFQSFWSLARCAAC